MTSTRYRYNVVSAVGVDVAEIDADLVASTNITNIPDRNVDIASHLKSSKRVTSFYLTKEEALKLEKDRRILAVEIDSSEDEERLLVNFATSTKNYQRSTDGDISNLGNWGLKRHAEENLDNYNNNGSLQTGHEQLQYNISGDGVDIIIMDSGLDGSHPDFLDENGFSRLQKINWWNEFQKYNETLPTYYTYNDNQITYNLAHQPEFYYRDISGHGTSAASVAAGLQFGMAKKAHIYLAKISLADQFGWNILPVDWYDLLINWHNNKGNNRPTILSQSWGETRPPRNYSEVTGGSYRDSLDDNMTAWTRTTQTNAHIAETYKMRLNIFTASGRPLVNTALDVLMQEMYDAGIHLITASGNSSHRMLLPDHPEYNNIANVTYTNESGGTVNEEIYYNRAGSPYLKEGIYVGAIDPDTVNTTPKKDKIIFYSPRGEAIDIYAATECGSAASSNRTYNDDFTTWDYPENTNYKAKIFGGTSCATPNVAGVAACYLSAHPSLTPKQLKEKLISESKEMLDTTFGTFNGNSSFLDSNNRVLYNRYNQDVSITTTNFSLQNGIIGSKPKFITRFRGKNEIGYDKYGVNIFGDYYNNEPATFDNNDVSMIYKNGVLLSLYGQTYNYQGDRLITLKFDGEVYNGGWTSIEWYSERFFDSYDESVATLYRKDATWDHVKKEFTWIMTFQEFRKVGLTQDKKLRIH